MGPTIPAVIVSQQHNGRQETSRIVADHPPSSYGSALSESPLASSATIRPGKPAHQHDHHDQAVAFEDDALEDVHYLDGDDDSEASDDGLEISLDGE
jgi:hypothetical protein